MDKEQEKIKLIDEIANTIKEQIHIGLKGNQLELWGFRLAALDSITLLENLGWKPPKEKQI